jgi:predicted GIY-YIG superfamily endonuclease
MYFIYALIDPRDNAVRYIGITNDVYARFYQHLRCDGTNVEKDNWIKELKTLNQMLLMRTLEEVETLGAVRVREQQLIRHYISTGSKLFNQQIEKPFTFDDFTEIMKDLSTPKKTEMIEPAEVMNGPQVPIEHFRYHTVNGVRRRRTYVSFEEASQCTGYTVEELKVLVKRQKIKMDCTREKLILTSLKAKPYFGTNILNRKKW